jgi:hypothetical protein
MDALIQNFIQIEIFNYSHKDRYVSPCQEKFQAVCKEKKLIVLMIRLPHRWYTLLL